MPSMKPTAKRYFATIIGSSFSGSLLAWILQRQNRDVLLLDRGTHPRFAIGESSTPTADFLLAHLSSRWRLPEIAPLACWGTWKEFYPEIRCGKKRGFSYFDHTSGGLFQDDQRHSHSLLVAASCEDRWSDTQWFREDVDWFFLRGASDEGVDVRESATLTSAQFEPSDGTWSVQFRDKETASHGVSSDWLIDASGSGNAIAPFVGQRDDSSFLRTTTGCLFGHFRNVGGFVEQHYGEAKRLHDPFSGDDAAQHHLFRDGWTWMIRFDDGTTSVGVVRPTTRWPRNLATSERKKVWQQTLRQLPSVDAIMERSQLTAPANGLGFLPRISRCLDQAAGRQWLSLPTTYGFIDPLHSTGIAHGLSGVARAAEILTAAPSKWNSLTEAYSTELRTEIAWIDQLVSGCYAQLPFFDTFIGYSAFYFLSAIAFEKQMASDPSHWPRGFMECKDHRLAETASKFEIPPGSGENRQAWFDSLRLAIKPWNHVGLLDPELRNRLNHTVAPKYASIALGKGGHS